MESAALVERTHAAVPTATPVRGRRSRLDSVDMVRGLVMVIMALDHTRDYLQNTYSINPVDLSTTNPALFLTRWITHYCAPTFVFLAGTGAFLAGRRGMTRGGLSWFLFSRGVWLVFLEVVVVRLCWEFAFNYRQSDGTWEIGAGVLWAIGWSMVALSGLCCLPTSVVTVIGLTIVLFHNHFDAITVKADNLGWFGPFWAILHSTERVQLFPNVFYQSGYGVGPWIGVICCGYGMGALLTLDRETRRPQLIGLGLALTCLFVALRFSNVYGDMAITTPNLPGPWSQQKSWDFTLFSFLNCQKYPPSLLYLLMTLGPAITLLGLFDREAGPIGRFFIVFGRVPLFYYLLHLPLIHAIAIGIDYYRFGASPFSSHGFSYLFLTPEAVPPNYGIPLALVYAVWAGVVLLLFPFCYWFARFKSRSTAAWLSYF
jgi:uncharacterized membrane protein